MSSAERDIAGTVQQVVDERDKKKQPATWVIVLIVLVSVFVLGLVIFGIVKMFRKSSMKQTPDGNIKQRRLIVNPKPDESQVFKKRTSTSEHKSAEKLPISKKSETSRASTLTLTSEHKSAEKSPKFKKSEKSKGVSLFDLQKSLVQSILNYMKNPDQKHKDDIQIQLDAVDKYEAKTENDQTAMTIMHEIGATYLYYIEKPEAFGELYTSFGRLLRIIVENLNNESFTNDLRLQREHEYLQYVFNSIKGNDPNMPIQQTINTLNILSDADAVYNLKFSFYNDLKDGVPFDKLYKTYNITKT